MREPKFTAIPNNDLLMSVERLSFILQNLTLFMNNPAADDKTAQIRLVINSSTGGCNVALMEADEFKSLLEAVLKFSPEVRAVGQKPADRG